MSNYNDEDALYTIQQARESWLSNLTLDKHNLKAVSIGLKRFLKEMEEMKFLKSCFDSADIGIIKMFISDAELYGDNDRLTLETNFATTQRIFDKAIAKLKS